MSRMSEHRRSDFQNVISKRVSRSGSEFARFTNFDSSGAVTGGFGFESVVTVTSHSSYNALQTSLSGNVGHGGPSLQAGYTWGKSLDDVSGVSGGTGSTGAVTLFSPQDPFDTRAERGPSSFDVTHAFTVSAARICISSIWDFSRIERTC